MKKRLVIALAALVLAFHPTQAAAYGGPSNVVIAQNQVDGHFVVVGRAQVNRVPGEVAAPLNYAMAQATTCTGCNTIAVALQLDFASTGAGYIAPQNAAVAVNGACKGCVTVAKAVQVVYTVDDPTQIPTDISAAIRDFDAELRTIANDRTLTMTGAEARVDAVIARFLATATSYDLQRQAAAQ
jgi:hypothetical protein